MAGQREREYMVEAARQKDIQTDFIYTQPDIQRCISDVLHGVLIREDMTAFNCQESAGTSDFIMHLAESSHCTTEKVESSEKNGEILSLNSAKLKSASGKGIGELCDVRPAKTSLDRISSGLFNEGGDNTTNHANSCGNIGETYAPSSARTNAASSSDIGELCSIGVLETKQNLDSPSLRKGKANIKTHNATLSRDSEEICTCTLNAAKTNNIVSELCIIGAETSGQNRSFPSTYEENCDSTTVFESLQANCCSQDHSSLPTGIDPIVLSPVTLELYHRRRSERNSLFNFETIDECSEADLVLIGEDRSLHSCSCFSDVGSSCSDLTDAQKDTMPKLTRNFQVPQKKSAVVLKRYSDANSTEDQQASRIALNVGGILYETYENTLAVFPDTLLGDPDRRIKYYDKKTNQYILARNIDCFDAILFYYQSNGILSKPLTVDRLTFESELEFFQINCGKTKKRFSDREWNPAARGLPSRKTPRRVLSKLFNRPFSSTIASIIAYFSIFIIIVSAIEFCIETLPQYRIHQRIDNKRGKGKGYRNRMKKHAVMDVIEAICMACFTVDFLIRVYIAPIRWKFIHSPLGIIDIVSLLPFYISLLSSSCEVPDNFVKTIELVRQLRLLQVFRLSRYSYGFRALLETISKSLMQLASYIFVIPIMAMFFAAVTFFAEDSEEKGYEQCRNQCKEFGSLSDWFWYSVITMTTVGYGDVYPRTIFGKLIGASCAIFGVVLFCLLTPIIFRHFVETYYVRGVMSRNITMERRRLAEKVTEMYYEQYEN